MRSRCMFPIPSPTAGNLLPLLSSNSRLLSSAARADATINAASKQCGSMALMLSGQLELLYAPQRFSWALG